MAIDHLLGWITLGITAHFEIIFERIVLRRISHFDSTTAVTIRMMHCRVMHSMMRGLRFRKHGQWR